MTPSFAGNAVLIKDETQRPVATVTLGQVNATIALAPAPIPSGVAIKNNNPFSENSTSLQRDGNPPSLKIILKKAVVKQASSPAIQTADHYVSEADGIQGFQAAIDGAQTGDTIHLSAGSFSGRVDFRFKEGVTIVGAGMGQTVISIDGVRYSGCGSGPSSTGPGVCGGSITWANSMTLSDLTLDLRLSSGAPEPIQTSGSHVTNVKFTGHSNVINITGSDNVLTNVIFPTMSVMLTGDHNTVRKAFVGAASDMGGSRTGVLISGSDNILDGVTVSINPYANAAGVVIAGDRNIIRNSIIQTRSTIRSGFSTVNAYGIHIMNGQGTLIEYSIIHTQGANGVFDIVAEGTSDINFGNNVFVSIDPKIMDSDYTPGQIYLEPIVKSDYKLLANSPAINTGDPALTDPDGSRLDIGFNFYDHRLPPPVPFGWTRAVSNVNFAFIEFYQSVGQYTQYTLRLQDLRSGQVQDIATRMSPYGGFTGTYDVSPDGTTVIYGKSGPISPLPVPHTVVLQRIGDPSQKLTLDGELRSVSFEQNGTVAVLRVQAINSVISQTVRVDLITLQRALPAVPQGWARTSGNGNFAYRVVTTRSYFSFTFQRLEVMDLVSGKVQPIFTMISSPWFSQTLGGAPVVSADGRSISVAYVYNVFGWRYRWAMTYSLRTGV